MNTAEQIMELADNMAAAASTMGMMGYSSLIENRKQLEVLLKQLYMG